MRKQLLSALFSWLLGFLNKCRPDGCGPHLDHWFKVMWECHRAASSFFFKWSRRTERCHSRAVFSHLNFYFKCYVNISVQSRRVQVQYYTHHYLGPRCCCVVFFPPIVFQHCFMWMTWWFAAAHFIRASLTDSVTKGASWLLLRCVKLTVFFLNYNCSAEPPFELAYESCVSPRALSAYL